MHRASIWVVCSWIVTCPLLARVPENEMIAWEWLPELPTTLGVAGAYAGISHGALIVAGGANFPEPLFRQDGQINPQAQKTWWDTIHVLPRADAAWQSPGRLARPLGYGAAVTWEEGVILIGGCDAQAHYADVTVLKWLDGQIQTTPLPSLPTPCAYGAAAVLGQTVYVAGGQDSPQATGAMSNFWALDLSRPDQPWQILTPWPGPERILPVVAAQDGAFFVVSGCQLIVNDRQEVSRRYLADGYRFTPDPKDPLRGTWKRIADLPEPVAAAPSPAPAVGQTHFLVLGGDHGRYAGSSFAPPGAHPGFGRTVLAYHTTTDTWAQFGTLPAGHVTTTAVVWDQRLVIPSGEIRPGVRSAGIMAGAFTELRSGFHRVDYAVWAAYLAAILGMGVYFSRRERATDDFFLGGRRVPWWAAGISVFGTQLSAITFMAIPAKVYATDWTYMIAQATIIMVAPLIVFYYLPVFRSLQITTAYEYLERRFGLVVRLLASTVFCLMQLGRMGIVLYLPALALSAVTNLNVYTCVLVMGVICTIYTVLGGIEAVIWTDVIQVIVLMGGAFLCVIVAAARVEGGLAGIIRIGSDAGKFHTFHWTWDYTLPAVWVVLIGNVFANLIPYSSDQTVVQRYLTTPSRKQAARAVWTNAALTVPGAVLFFFLGTALYAYYRTAPENLNPSLSTDAILPWFLARELPVGLTGLVLAAVFAAAMSSLDSSMNSMATVLVTDFYYRFRPASSDGRRLLLARILTVALGAFGTTCALLMASFPIASLWDLFMTGLGLLGSGLAGVFLLGVFTQRTNSRGALAGFAASTIVLVLVQRHTTIHFFLYAPLGIFSCTLIGYAISRLLPVWPPDASALRAMRES